MTDNERKSCTMATVIIIVFCRNSNTIATTFNQPSFHQPNVQEEKKKKVPGGTYIQLSAPNWAPLHWITELYLLSSVQEFGWSNSVWPPNTGPQIGVKVYCTSRYPKLSGTVHTFRGLFHNEHRFHNHCWALIYFCRGVSRPKGKGLGGCEDPCCVGSSAYVASLSSRANPSRNSSGSSGSRCKQMGSGVLAMRLDRSSVNKGQARMRCCGSSRSWQCWHRSSSDFPIRWRWAMKGPCPLSVCVLSFEKEMRGSSGTVGKKEKVVRPLLLVSHRCCQRSSVR